MMAKTARTRNTKEIICPAEGSVDFDPVLKVARLFRRAIQNMWAANS